MPRFSHLACPLDGQPLTLTNKSLTCPDGHTYDVARQGYVHLLPVQQKKSRAPGDSAVMVEARSRFLDAGHYQPIADLLADRVSFMLPADGPAVVVDAGCGDGYYLEQLQRRLAGRSPHHGLDLIGLDIAKPAVLAAARRSRACTWLVASNVRPPILPGSVDLVLCLFGFPNYAAFARILRPGGRILLVDPGPEHLIELREILYPEVRRTPPPSLREAEQAGLQLMDTRPLRFRTGQLSRSALNNLLAMTPHGYRASAAGKAAMAAVDTLDLTADVIFRELRLSNSGIAESDAFDSRDNQTS